MLSINDNIEILLFILQLITDMLEDKKKNNFKKKEIAMTSFLQIPNEYNSNLNEIYINEMIAEIPE